MLPPTSYHLLTKQCVSSPHFPQAQDITSVVAVDFVLKWLKTAHTPHPAFVRKANLFYGFCEGTCIISSILDVWPDESHFILFSDKHKTTIKTSHFIHFWSNGINAMGPNFYILRLRHHRAFPLEDFFTAQGSVPLWFLWSSNRTPKSPKTCPILFSAYFLL